MYTDNIPILSVSEKKTPKRTTIQGFISLFYLFLSPIMYYLSRDRTFLVRRIFGYVSLIVETIREETSKRLVKSMFSSVM